ncbi:serine protease [Streptacidiphilus sp. P02-A3a]|uniref:serine protease n=1 Tax=Streptacidiphilus sp. P02-A3a TaxID=2704468 RepID=UPI0015FCF9E2|nr:serine protease [Streptacidiphilus sp. P02-A3a]QMU72988.1 NACHT domain-containing protein [Streptacidiphilus sp. P02-A3a]
MPHPRRDRIAAVFGARQGSGYLLGPRLVLTAAHLLGPEPPEVVVPGGPGRVRCQVLWSRHDEGCDAALLRADRALTSTPGSRFRNPVWGRIGDLFPREGAHAVGFPQVQRDLEGELDSEQLVGTLKPGTGLLTGRMVLDSAHGAPAAPRGGGSPWAGLSGAAVFLGERLVGVVRADPGNWQHGRVELTPTAAILDSHQFLPMIEMFSPHQNSSVLEPPTPPSRDEFEERLREFVVRQTGRLQIIGLSRSPDQEDSWPLDAGYLSLELVAGTAGRAADEPPQSQRAEQALSGRRRILIRGAAGSGKSTLLFWLANCTASRGLPVQLADLLDCVPLLVRLRALPRHGELPAPEELLALVAKPLSGHPAAAGWVTRQLELGRVLLLVDGVDEVPEADRARTRAWLTELLAAYPDVRYVVTTRPSAVREGWLTQAGFTELELLPMSRADVAAFITRWHRAAGTDERLTGWRDSLTAAVVRKQDLGRLATSPLMCALICALNRDRRGYLPEGRMELYSAALEMLLVRRDRERGIAVPEGFRLTADQQITLLQRLAYWLAANGTAEIDRALAVRKLADALPAMAGINGDGEQLLRHLLVRSGLLRQPTADSVDFIHRTFQDYLAAKAAIEEEDLGVLVRNAHDDQWDDILRMAVGHARPKERARLLRALLARAESDTRHSFRLRVLAAACLEHATELDPVVRQEIAESTAEVIPPRTDAAAKALAAAGSMVLDLLPGPEGLVRATAHAVVVAASTVAGAAAIPLLAQYADHESTSVRGQLAWAWERFDTREYGEQVIARLTHGDGLRFIAKSREQLAYLLEIGGRPSIECSGWLPDSDLRLLAHGPLASIRLHENPGRMDLCWLTECPELRSLHLINCTGRIDLAVLPELALDNLVLVDCPNLESLRSLGRATTLRRLRYGPSSLGTTRAQPLWLPPSLRELEVHEPTSLIGLAACGELRLARLNADELDPDRWAELSVLPELSELHLSGEPEGPWAARPPMRSVRKLSLNHAWRPHPLRDLALAFPNLERLDLLGAPERRGEFRIDVESLRDLHGCEVRHFSELVVIP